MTTLCDPRDGGYPHLLDFTPNTHSDFMWWHGERREIREIHSTKNGTQIELF